MICFLLDIYNLKLLQVVDSIIFWISLIINLDFQCKKEMNLKKNTTFSVYACVCACAHVCVQLSKLRIFAEIKVVDFDF